MSATTFTIASRPYYNRNARSSSNCYTNLLIVEGNVCGPLASITRRISFSPLTAFGEWGGGSSSDSCPCAMVILLPQLQSNNACKSDSDLPYAKESDLHTVISFLVMSGYQIETHITAMCTANQSYAGISNTSKMMCMVTYNPNAHVTYTR